MTKNKDLITLALKIMENRLKPVIDKSMSMQRKPIPYNPTLDENDYAEYLAKKANKLTHINNRKDDNNGR